MNEYKIEKQYREREKCRSMEMSTDEQKCGQMDSHEGNENTYG